MLNQITKTQARKLYEGGKPVIMCARNLRPYQWGIKTNKNRNGGAPFETVVNEFKYFNCINAETGKTVAFYQ